jgi:Phage protein (N4 Gp49/phage Sf6 gene 66) family
MSSYRADGGLEIRHVHTNINTGEAKMPTVLTEAEQRESAEERKERTGLSSLEIADQESAAVQKTKHRVTLDSMLAKIAHEEYIWPTSIRHMTICILITENGFALVGKSAPADPDNFDIDLGKKFAKEDALRQMWSLEAYLLRERMML